MPVYEYMCRKCSNRFELKSSFDSEPEMLCPKCKSRVRRIIFPTPVIFRGSGFYVTDHRK